MPAYSADKQEMREVLQGIRRENLEHVVIVPSISNFGLCLLNSSDERDAHLLEWATAKS